MMNLRWLMILGWVAVVGCRSPNPAAGSVEEPDLYFHRMITSGHASFRRGNVERAAELYENAWVRAQVMDRPLLMGTSAYNLAISLIALGDVEHGLTLLQTSQAELMRAGDSGADALTAQAEALRILERRPEAWQVTDQLLALSIPRPVRLQTHSLRAMLALDDADLERALEEQGQAQRLVRRQTPTRLLARLAEGDGRIAIQQGDLLTAAEAFDRAARLYRDEGRFPDMARALAEAGRLYALAEQPANAIDRYFRAARHHAAAGETAKALQLLDVAVDVAAETEESMEHAHLAQLFEDLQNEMKNQRRADVKEKRGDPQ